MSPNLLANPCSGDTWRLLAGPPLLRFDAGPDTQSLRGENKKVLVCEKRDILGTLPALFSLETASWRITGVEPGLPHLFCTSGPQSPGPGMDLLTQLNQ